MKKFEIEFNVVVTTKQPIEAESYEEAMKIFEEELVRSKHLTYKLGEGNVTSDSVDESVISDIDL